MGEIEESRDSEHRHQAKHLNENRRGSPGAAMQCSDNDEERFPDKREGKADHVNEPVGVTLRSA